MYHVYIIHSSAHGHMLFSFHNCIKYYVTKYVNLYTFPSYFLIFLGSKNDCRETVYLLHKSENSTDSQNYSGRRENTQKYNMNQLRHPFLDALKLSSSEQQENQTLSNSKYFCKNKDYDNTDQLHLSSLNEVSKEKKEFNIDEISQLQMCLNNLMASKYVLEENIFSRTQSK